VGSYNECQQREAFIDDLVYRDWDIIPYDKDEENRGC
jgi:hypothetical protein